MEEDNDEQKSLDESPKYFAAIQITRPRLASVEGSLASRSSINQKFKVAKLVLKPVPSKANVPIKNNQRNLSSTSSTSVRPVILSEHDSVIKTTQQQQKRGIELERAKNSEIGKEKSKTLKSPQQHHHRVQSIQKQQQIAPVLHTTSHHKSKLSEEEKREARQFMKKQREKRKMEAKKDVDKSFVIKQRLDELRMASKNAVLKKPPQKVAISPIRQSDDYYSMENYKMKEIKVLKLKPVSSPLVENLSANQEVIMMSSKQASPVKKPITQPTTTTKKSSISPIPLQPQNQLFQAQKHDSSRAASAKENKRPLIDDLKLKVPDIKLNLTSNNSALFNKTDILPSSTAPAIPYFLQNVYQPYPHNFIWAVRKKLEAFTKEHEQKVVLETPQRKNSFKKPIKGRKIPHDLIPEVDSDDDSETNAKSMEMQSEANTISEISSIRTDLAKSKSQSNEKTDNDDTTISESIFQSIADDPFVGKKRESVNSEFDRASFDAKVQEKIESLSPNTTEKRINFLSVPQPAPRKIPQEKPANDDEEDFRKMLLDFNKSLSHVVEVNHLLSSALISKSTTSSKSDAFVQTERTTSSSKQEYSSSFEKNIDTNNEHDSSIQTLIEESSSTLKKPNDDDVTIEDSSINYQQEHPHELTSSTTKVTRTEIVRSELEAPEKEEKEQHDNTLNESQLINIFKLTNDAEVSFNTSTTLAESNGSLSSHAAFAFNKSSTEIKSWEKSLIERTRGQIAWLELQKQHFKRHGQVEKVSALKRQQRAILMQMDKERAQLRHENSRKALRRFDEDLIEKAVGQLDASIDFTGNGSDARENIERILQKREEKIDVRRKKIEYLMRWQRRLDEEENRLKKMENDLLNFNSIKTSKNPQKHPTDILNASFEMVKSIDKSLRVLENVQVNHEEETVPVSGQKLNKLWHRLTGIVEDKKFPKNEIFHLTKTEIAKFYEDAKETVLESDLKLLLETSAIPQKSSSSQSDVDTMNSIANIETEEEYPGSSQQQSEETQTAEHDEELEQFMANQMKVFVTSPPQPQQQQLPTIVNNQTFQVHDGGESTPHEIMTNNSHDESASILDVVVNEDEESSPIYTEPIHSIDLSASTATAAAGDESIILEVSKVQVTDMDEDFLENKLIEDISFPNLEISMCESVPNYGDLSTITECTEYEQISSEPISSEIVVASRSSSSSEKINSEIELRLISINDSLEQVDQAFKKVALVQTPSTEATYSTDKDFKDFEKSQDLLILSPQQQQQPASSESSSSLITTSTPKNMHDGQ